MPRDIPVGNGQMLVTFDHHYQIRDLYFPHVGQENHGGGGPCRFGVWADIPDGEPGNGRRKQRLFWTYQGWQIDQRYQTDTLTTEVKLSHPQLQLELTCNDAVDFHRPVMVRRIEVHNPTDEHRTAHLFHHNDFYLYGTRLGDTAYYDPQLRCLIHYRKQRYLMTSFYVDGDQQVHQFATGTAGFHGAEGTWRDAEDGQLGQNAIAQGAVDSTMMVPVPLEPHSTRVVHMVIGAGCNYKDIETLHRFLHRESPQGVIDRSNAYWKLWLDASRVDFSNRSEAGLSPQIEELFRRSLLVVRTQIDNGGAVIAANDSDIMQFSRDTYSYLWPRDGAFVVDAIDAAGFPDIARSFFDMCGRIISSGGYFLHKYTPDGSLASSWHPWVSNGKPQLPIQEDETALVLWSLWRHFQRYQDIEFVRKLWADLIRKAADFLVRFRDPVTKLPLPSYDLWEERWGIHAFTVATVYGGLRAAERFAKSFGDGKRARSYADAAAEIREAFDKYFWSEEHGHYLRRIVPLDHDRTAEQMSDVMAGRAPGDDDVEESALEFERDAVLDASMFAIFSMDMLPIEDARVDATMQAIHDELKVKTKVGGYARYRQDYYHSVTDRWDTVPGNPWFICTLWIADWLIEKATSFDELRKAVEILDWVANHTLPSGVLAEQVHPQTNAPLSVSPLTWSHATVVATVTNYLKRYREIDTGLCELPGQMRRQRTKPPMSESKSPTSA